MLGFRWEQHTTTTCLCSGGKNTQAKTCLGSGGKNTQLQHAWVQVGKTDKLKKTCLSSGGKSTQAITCAINYISVNMYTWNFTIFLVKGEETIIVCAIYKRSCKNKNIY